ncbi:MAG: alcohol dehydrogenase catalytic domain-containing protein [Firmicutes bacterium]|nr:alcohol dehydrogenase catalytic domain-containing protein [Bacillota bacterium]MDH7495292.1 alcohol dehydrogenase catalytic domain-containing protein [Bacillota bacterium]
MKAAVYYSPRDVRVEEVPMPRLEAGEALLKVEYCGVCGTDVKTYLRGHPMFEPPCILGHEPVGEIVEVRQGRAGRGMERFSVGDKVAVAPYVPCDNCRQCLKGRQEMCASKDGISGAFCEYVRVPSQVLAKGVSRIPDALSARVACLAEPLACCLNALEVTPFDPGDCVLVHGAGPMGLLMLELCKARGAGSILVSEPCDARRSEAQRRGAQVIDPRQEDVRARVSSETRGDGADAAFICVGAGDALKDAVASVAPGGKVNVFGGFPSGSSVALDPNAIHYREVAILGSFGFAPRHFHMAMRLLGSGRLDVEDLVSREFTLEDVGLALDAGASGETLKVLLRCS